MVSTYSHVQSNQPMTLWDVDAKSPTERWILSHLSDLRPFWNEQQFLEAKRHYDGEIEALFVLAYLRSLSRYPARKKVFEKSIRPRLNRIGKEDPRAIRTRLHHVIAGGKWVTATSKDGLLLLPFPLEGIALLAILLLLHKDRLSRIRKCKRCGTWFYARFKHAQFCSTRCQEAHYHTPEWRKLHREPNRKYQSESRKRDFGKRGEL